MTIILHILIGSAVVLYTEHGVLFVLAKYHRMMTSDCLIFIRNQYEDWRNFHQHA